MAAASSGPTDRSRVTMGFGSGGGGGGGVLSGEASGMQVAVTGSGEPVDAVSPTASAAERGGACGDGAFGGGGGGGGGFGGGGALGGSAGGGGDARMASHARWTRLQRALRMCWRSEMTCILCVRINRQRAVELMPQARFDFVGANQAKRPTPQPARRKQQAARHINTGLLLGAVDPIMNS